MKQVDHQKELSSESLLKKRPLRMCIACGEMKPKSELIRIVKNKEGEISLHLEGHKEGRGLYLCNQEACIKKLPKCGKRVYKAYQEMLPVAVVTEINKLGRIASTD